MANTGRWQTLGLAFALALGGPAQALREVVWAGDGAVIVRGGFQGELGGPIMWIDPMPVDAGPQVTDGFNVAAGGTAIQDTPAGEALKHIHSGDWLKAITAIESLDTDNDQLVLDPNGILRPLSSLKGALLASMPDDGKRTFRQLNNPAAQARLDIALAEAGLADRGRALQSIVRDYGLCDAAARAADALGDMRFEQGRFDEAAGLYRFAAEHNASKPDDPAMMTKRLFATARAQRWQAFDALAEYARFRHPDTPVTVGGVETALHELIAELERLKQQTEQRTAPALPAVEMPALTRPSFDRPLIDERQIQWLRTGAMQQRMPTMIVDLIVKPVVATDGERVFTLALGSVARVDPETGSDVWRKGDPDEHAQELSNRFYQLQQGYEQALVVHGDTLLAVMPEARTPNRSRLIAYDTQTGDERWDLRRTGASFSQHGVIGEPLIQDDFIYTVANQPGNPQLKLLVLERATGGVAASLDLGSAAMDPNLGAPAELSPRLAMGQGYLFVLTNNGAMIAVDPQDHTIAWAFTQNIRPSGMGMLRRNRQFVPGSIARHAGDLVARDGLVIAKDTRSNMVHAFGEHNAAPLWSAPTDRDATIVHADDRHVYVLGQELVAHDLATGERVWWTPHAGEKTGAPVFGDDACVLAGSNRMTRVDLATGKLTGYRDDLSEPAAMAVAGGLLIRATDDRLLGYRMAGPDHPEQP